MKGADVKDDSLKGSKIVETSLDTGQFTAAASTPFDPAGPIRCDPEFGSGAPFVPCGEVSLKTPVAGRILVIAAGELIAEGSLASGHCRLYLDGVEIGALADRTRGDYGFAVSGVSEPVAGATHLAELRCLESSGELRAEVNSITAVLVGG